MVFSLRILALFSAYTRYIFVIGIIYSVMLLDYSAMPAVKLVPKLSGDAVYGVPHSADQDLGQPVVLLAVFALFCLGECGKQVVMGTQADKECKRHKPDQKTKERAHLDKTGDHGRHIPCSQSLREWRNVRIVEMVEP